MLRVAEYHAFTDTGQQRRHNEDAYYARSPVFAVADGMGGAQAGEVASHAAVEAVAAGLPEDGTPEDRLAAVVRRANEEIFRMSREDDSRAGMGTISMYINGRIHNKGSKTIDILEVNTAVVTQFNSVLKEKRMLVVPRQQATLEPGATVPITLTIDGFSKDDDRANIRWKVTAIRATN